MLYRNIRQFIIFMINFLSILWDYICVIYKTKFFTLRMTAVQRYLKKKLLLLWFAWVLICRVLYNSYKISLANDLIKLLISGFIDFFSSETWSKQNRGRRGIKINFTSTLWSSIGFYNKNENNNMYMDSSVKIIIRIKWGKQ